MNSMPATVCASATVCRRIRVRGQVQGVGFRPFVYRLAQELNIAGWVRNDGEGVDIEAQGAAKMIEVFIVRLETEAPPLASVTAVETAEAPTRDARGFEIIGSLHGTANTAVTPDTATCTFDFGAVGTGTDGIGAALLRLAGGPSWGLDVRCVLHRRHRTVAVRTPGGGGGELGPRGPDAARGSGG